MYFDIYLSSLSMDTLVYFHMFIINKWYITVQNFIIDSYYMSNGLWVFLNMNVGIPQFITMNVGKSFSLYHS